MPGNFSIAGQIFTKPRVIILSLPAKWVTVHEALVPLKMVNLGRHVGIRDK